MRRGHPEARASPDRGRQPGQVETCRECCCPRCCAGGLSKCRRPPAPPSFTSGARVACWIVGAPAKVRGGLTAPAAVHGVMAARRPFRGGWAPGAGLGHIGDAVHTDSRTGQPQRAAGAFGRDLHGEAAPARAPDRPRASSSCATDTQQRRGGLGSCEGAASRPALQPPAGREQQQQ